MATDLTLYPYKLGPRGRFINIDSSGRLYTTSIQDKFKDFNVVVPKESGGIAPIDNDEGFATAGFHLTVPSGSKECLFEGTFDNINWVPLIFKSPNDELYRTSASGDNSFVGSVAAFRKFRINNNETGFTDGRIIGRLSRTTYILEGIQSAPRPHNFGTTLIYKNGNFTSQQTDTLLWTPTPGTRFVLTEVNLSMGGTVNGIITIFEETNNLQNQILRTHVKVGGNNSEKRDSAFRTPYVSQIKNGTIRITSSAAITFSVHLRGFEELI